VLTVKSGTKKGRAEKTSLNIFSYTVRIFDRVKRKAPCHVPNNHGPFFLIDFKPQERKSSRNE